MQTGFNVGDEVIVVDGKDSGAQFITGARGRIYSVHVTYSLVKFIEPYPQDSYGQPYKEYYVYNSGLKLLHQYSDPDWI